MHFFLDTVASNCRAELKIRVLLQLHLPSALLWCWHFASISASTPPLRGASLSSALPPLDLSGRWWEEVWWDVDFNKCTFVSFCFYFSEAKCDCATMGPFHVIEVVVTLPTSPSPHALFCISECSRWMIREIVENLKSLWYVTPLK